MSRGINPKIAMAQSATAFTQTVRQLSQKYLKDYVHSKALDSAKNYENAFETHINPIIGDKLAELVTREDAREVMNAARVKRPRPRAQGWAARWRGGGPLDDLSVAADVLVGDR